jgi:hypothetical protein
MVMRPIDVAALIDLGQNGDEDDAGCYTISQCLDEGGNDWYGAELDSDCGGDDNLCELLEDPAASCWSEIQVSYPEVAGRAPASCGS